ncbi:MAG TPA: hypothetical protein PL045_02820, partial [Chitinophagaceae bacterium]|nr:hypothetical protein [Chitinophagaceae bacterium]
MINAVRKTAYRHGYLFIAAAWLYTISFLFTNYFSPSSSAEKAANAISRYISGKEKDFEKLVKDTAFIRSITSSAHWTQTKNTDNEDGLFLYVLNDKGNPLQVHWNTNMMGVSEDDLKKPDGFYPVKYQNGFFILMKYSFHQQNRNYIIARLTPIYWSYFVSNDYLKPHFAKFDELTRKYSISIDEEGIPVKDSKGKAFFFIQEEPGASTDQPGAISILLRLLGIILLMVFLNSIAFDLAAEKGFLPAFLFLLFFIVLLRTLSFLLPFPFDYRMLELFDTLNYASSNFNSSLGDLLINVILVFWITGFIKFNINRLLNDESKLNDNMKKAIAVLSLLLLPVITNITSSTISSLISDSQISLDVTDYKILTDPLAIISLFIICFIVLSYFYVFQLLVNFSSELKLSLFWKLTIICSAALALVSLNFDTDSSTLLNYMIILWLLLTYTIASYRARDVTVSLYNSGLFIVWSIYLMSSTAGLLIYQNIYNDQNRRKNIVQKYAGIYDPANESLLSLATATFSDKSLEENFNRFRRSSSNKFLKDSLMNANFSGFLNKFDTRIYTYDSSGNPLYNEENTPYTTLKEIITSQGKLTDIEGLYYYEKSKDDYTYIYEREVPRDSAGINGYLLLII